MPSENPSSGELFRAALQRTQDCPPLEALERFLDGADSAAAAHVQGCAFCATELQLLKSFRLAEIPPEDASAVKAIAQRLSRHPVGRSRLVDEQRKSWWRFGGSWLQPAALATAAVFVVIAIGFQLRHTSQPALRNVGTGGEVFRSDAITILSPAGDLSQSPELARWQPAPGAATYRVRLLEVDGNELWSSQTADAGLAFPPAIRAQIVPSKTLLITVTALDASGQKIAESGNVRFRLLQKVYSQ